MKRLVLFILVFVIANYGLQSQTRVTGGYPINITEAPCKFF